MKRIILSFALVCACVAGALEGPSVYKMTEAQLLDVAKAGALADRMTACQELAHRGTAASVPVLAEMLKSGEPSVFHSALYALQNIPGAEVDAALAAILVARPFCRNGDVPCQLDAILLVALAILSGIGVYFILRRQLSALFDRHKVV